ncbi:class I SAM-dependent methyltransferase [Legionella genomosp. 1]|uniref:class I SAM-dependent methyltransferase n=1 Tax=Legionella genomosp. 1 TaxID=1093625 RepID=UPI0010543AE3|nr:class I SAM-dependent methyltransferase [Legionella genomosp. 1]
MRKCLACSTLFLAEEHNCHACEGTYSIVDGFPSFAPSLAHEGIGFDPESFAALARFEAANFWFRARNHLITWSLSHYRPEFQSFLEIGCGTGFVLWGISKLFPEARLHGSELFTAGLQFAAQRLPSASLMQMDARNIPFDNEFDAIGAFDVIEHIEEDSLVLEQIFQALKPGGVCLISVPQHPWLWSPMDEYACHVRRYKADELHDKVRGAGFKILRSTSFVTSLLPAMMLSRFVQQFKGPQAHRDYSELKMSPVLNFIFEKMLRAEIGLIKKGINFPVGGSRFVVAEKP